VRYYNYYLPLNVPFLLRVVASVERVMRHEQVSSAVLHSIDAIKVWMRLISGQNEKHRAMVLKYRRDLIDRLDESETIREFFNNSGLRAVIDEETSILGLERLRIIFAALSKTAGWISRFPAYVCVSC
jgi:hypothetical protein